MRRRGIIVPAVVALAAAGLALAQVEDSIVLRAIGGNAVAHYSPTLAAVAVSPPEYERGCCYDSDGGEWTGPRYQATGMPSLGGNAAIDWGVAVAVRAPDTRAALIANLTHDWPVVSEGQQQVEHRVGGGAVGTIDGYWILTRSVGGVDDAQMEAAVGFPLCDGNTAYAKFSLLLPSTNSAGGTLGFGEYVINGMRPTDWNAEKAMQSIRGMRLEGNRPATQVTSAARGRRVSGRVADCDAHPLAGLAVQLQRRAGGSWRTVSSARTSAGGTYSLTAPSAGTYRVRAETRTSAPVVVAGAGAASAPGAPPQGTATGTVLVNGRPFTSGSIPLGSTVDVTAGRLTLTADVGTLVVYGAGKLTAKFVPRRATEVVNGNRRALIELTLAGGDFGSCRRTLAGRVQQGEPKEVRRLWGNGRGSFRTRGRYASATVRGTLWGTTDRCDGTLTTVRQGSVSVTDFTLRRTVSVGAGRSYLAPARRP